MQAPEQQIHLANYEGATSKLVFDTTAPGELLPGTPYTAELIPVADIGTYLKTMRGSRSQASVVRESTLSKGTVHDIEHENVIPYLETANKIYQTLGGRLLCLAISSMNINASKRKLHVAGPDDQMAIKPWYTNKRDLQDKNVVFAAAKRAGISLNTLRGFEGEVQDHVRPLVLEFYASNILDMQVEFCGIQ